MAKASATIDISALKVASEGASKYITEIGSDGIKVKKNGTTKGVTINSDGLMVYNNDTTGNIDIRALFGATTYIGYYNDIPGAPIGGISDPTNNLVGDFALVLKSDQSGNSGLGVIQRTSGQYVFWAGADEVGPIDSTTGERQSVPFYTFGARTVSTNGVGSHSFVAGWDNNAEGRNSVALGLGLITTKDYQIACGKYNKADPAGLFIVGNGSDSNNQNNAFVIGSTLNQQVQEQIEFKTNTTSTITTSKTISTQDTTINISDQNGNTYSGEKTADKTIVLTPSPADGTVLRVIYTTSENNGYLYTADKIMSLLGAHSFSQGEGQATGNNSQAFGSILHSKTASLLHECTIQASGQGSSAYGVIRNIDSGGGAIEASQDGTLAGGVATAGGKIIASGTSTIALGYSAGGLIAAEKLSAIALGVSSGTIRSSGSGSIAFGYSSGGTIVTTSWGGVSFGYAQGANTSIKVQGRGALAFGKVEQGDDTIEAADHGSLAHGSTYFGDIIATKPGAMAGGYASGNSQYNSLITAIGNGSFAHGVVTHSNNINGIIIAQGSGSIACGCASGGTMLAAGAGSAVFNEGTKAQGRAQTAIGTYNIEDSSITTSHPSGNAVYQQYAFIIGNGTSESAPSNALAVDWEGGITIANHSSPIGTLVRGVMQADVTATSGQWKSLNCYVDLDPGTWLITCGVRWPSNSTGRRVANCADTEGDNANEINATPAPGIATQLRWVKVVQTTQTKRYYLNAYHNAGTTLTMAANTAGYGNYIDAIRIQ